MASLFVPRSFALASLTAIAAAVVATPAQAQRPGTYDGAQIQYLFSGSQVIAEGGGCSSKSASMTPQRRYWSTDVLLGAVGGDYRLTVPGWNGGSGGGGNDDGATPFLEYRLAGEGGGDGGDGGHDGGEGDGGGDGGGSQDGAFEGEYKWDFKFAENGGVTIEYTCSAALHIRGEGTGKWWIDRSWLCLESDLPAFRNTFPDEGACWQIGKGRFGFVAYDYTNQTVFAHMAVHHPEHNDRDELMAALSDMRGSAVAQVPTPRPAAPAVQAGRLAEDMAAWKAVENSTRIDEIQGYLNAFPQGQFSTVANMKIQQLAALQAARQQQELTAWQAIENSTEESDFAAYLARYPNGVFAGLATSRIAAIRAQPATPAVDRELALWEQVKDTSVVADLDNYLNSYPSGRFAGQARERKRELAALARQWADDALWNSVRGTEDIGELDQYLAAYPGGRHADEARQRKQTLAAVQRERAERALWASVKGSNRIADLRSYLERFPDGAHVAQVQARLAVLEKFSEVADVEFGDYHALVIGIEDYKHLPKLQTAVADAKGVAKVLEKDYGFRVTLMVNPSRLDIIDAFDELRDTLGYKDNLLVYYAGHGWMDEETNRGYWLPVDAKPGRRGRWVSNITLTDTLRGLQSKHAMIVADSCFSGTLVRAASVGLKGGDYWRRMADKPARVAITSGGLEPVADKGGGNHSPFAKAFIEALQSNEVVIDGSTLFNEIRRPVMVSAKQTPQYSDVRDAGHDGGDFLFVKRR